ncbi:cyclin-dependent kinase 1-like [Teleopsis dalmanni]|uniref:cyclin-dependent kinase 1-like n=1 Tax=Teleopsis dalmanni TaxID=139649 RepID=UPI0018CD6AD2|nr:cyclin-dependent kinase 1-like [Teleopsis dalmanni]
MNSYQKLEKIGEGSYGIVYRGKNLLTAQMVAMKKIKVKANDEGIPATAIREISLLQKLKHPHIVCLEDILMEADQLYLVFEYMLMNLKQYMNCKAPKKYINDKLLRSYLHQITDAVYYCHCRRIVHRDLKPQNLLVDEKGTIKLADFGSGRCVGVPVRPYTNKIVTLWYRAPEILLGSPRYTFAVDIWSIGCIFVEMATGKPLINGDSEIDQLFRMFKTLETPTEIIWPGVSSLPNYKASFAMWSSYTLPAKLKNVNELGCDLIKKMLIYDPIKRISAKDILKHPYFNGGNVTMAA